MAVNITTWPGHFSNRVKMVSSYLRRGAGARFYPQEIVIELTNHCNLACVMCPHEEMTRKRGYMEEGLFRKVIDEVRGKTELVYLYGTGESLLHKGLYSMTEYASDAGLATCLSTNGQLMDEESSRRLLDCGLDFLIIALDGGVKQTYESIRVRGNFERLVDNIRTLLRLKEEMRSRTNICLQMIYMEDNAYEVDLFRNLFDQRQSAQVNQFRFKPLFETYANHDRTVHHTKPCYWLWNMMSVTWQGQVDLCCMDFDATYNFGDLNNQSVAEVWNSPAMTVLRARHGVLDYDGMRLCATCDIPEQGYFRLPYVVGSAFVDASFIRRVMPTFEKLFLLGQVN